MTDTADKIKQADLDLAAAISLAFSVPKSERYNLAKYLAKHRETAEKQAFTAAYDRVRGTNADMSKSAQQAYQLCCAAVNELRVGLKTEQPFEQTRPPISSPVAGELVERWQEQWVETGKVQDCPLCKSGANFPSEHLCQIECQSCGLAAPQDDEMAGAVENWHTLVAALQAQPAVDDGGLPKFPNKDILDWYEAVAKIIREGGAHSIIIVSKNGQTETNAYTGDVYAALATHQGQSAAALDWQPIETAPKDGTRVIVAKIDWMHGNLKDAFNEEPKDKYSVWWVSQAQFDQKREKWNDGLESLVPPTHWLPLSTPAPHAGPQGCEIPPPGWYCTRAAGHEGPCAAIEVSRALKELEG